VRQIKKGDYLFW